MNGADVRNSPRPDSCPAPPSVPKPSSRRRHPWISAQRIHIHLRIRGAGIVARDAERSRSDWVSTIAADRVAVSGLRWVSAAKPKRCCRAAIPDAAPPGRVGRQQVNVRPGNRLLAAMHHPLDGESPDRRIPRRLCLSEQPVKRQEGEKPGPDTGNRQGDMGTPKRKWEGETSPPRNFASGREVKRASSLSPIQSREWTANVVICRCRAPIMPRYEPARAHTVDNTDSAVAP